MEDQNPEETPDFIEIPKIFYSDSTGAPLDECIMCGNRLLEPGTPYVIEKAIRQHKKFNTRDTIFEYAMCFDCYEKMSSTISMESMLRLATYFNQHTNLISRRSDLLSENKISMDEWLGHCVIKGTPMKDCSEFQICCQCDGKNMLFTHMPIMLSEEALLEISERLSAETKEEFDRFQENLTDVPPELRELFKERGVLVV